MRRSALFFAGLSCVLALTGCVNREQADAKLAKACAAGVDVLLPEGQKVGEIKGSTFGASPVGPGYRNVDIHAVTMDGWLETETDYTCIFEESFSFLNTGYTASIYQVRTGERVIGKSGNEILGDAEDFIKLTDAVRDALYK